MKRLNTCSAYDDRGTGTIICNRCGYQWDKDDSDPPPCKPRNTRTHGNEVLKRIREDLEK